MTLLVLKEHLFESPPCVVVVEIIKHRMIDNLLRLVLMIYERLLNDSLLYGEDELEEFIERRP